MEGQVVTTIAGSAGVVGSTNGNGTLKVYVVTLLDYVIATATVAPDGTYSSTPGLIIDASTGAITPATSTAGTYTITYTMPAAGGCTAQTAATTVIISAVPTLTASSTATCVGGSTGKNPEHRRWIEACNPSGKGCAGCSQNDNGCG